MATAAVHRASVPAHTCESCDGLIEGWDSHCLCVPCLGVHHAMDAASDPRSCAICADWSQARLLKRLAEVSTYAAIQGSCPVSFGAPGKEAPAPRMGHSERVPRAERSTSSPRRRSPLERSAQRGQLAATGGASHHQECSQRAHGEHASRARHGRSAAASLSYPDDDSDMDQDEELPSYQPDVSMISPPPARRTAEASSQSFLDDCSSSSGGSGEEGASAAPARRGYAASAISSVPASEPGDSKPSLPVSTIFKRAVARCGLSFGSEYAEAVGSQPARGSRMVGGVAAPVKPQPKNFKKLPVATGLRETLFDGMAMSKDPAAVRFPVDMEECEALGLAKIPGVSHELAEVLAKMLKDKAKPAFDLTTDPSTFKDPAIASASRLNATAYERAAHPVRYCNASALLLASLHHLLDGAGETHAVSSDFFEEVSKIKELLVTLNEQTTLWLGFMIGSCIRMERDRWTQFLDFQGCPPTMKNDLRHDKMTARALFPSGYDRLKRRSDDVRAREKMVAAVTNLVPPTSSPAPQAKSKKKGTRSSSASSDRRSDGSAAGAATSSAAPPPADAGRGRAAAAVPKDDPCFLKPDPPRATGRGRGGKKGK